MVRAKILTGNPKSVQAGKKQKYTCKALSSMISFVEKDVPEHNVGQMENVCAKCGALMFHDETHKTLPNSTQLQSYSMCCSNGKIQIPPVSELPEILQNLLSSSSSKSQNFRQHIRMYNSIFAFASMSLTGEEYQFPTSGPYCFRINGQVYHSISQLQPSAGQNPKFSQIYLYDSLEQISTWYKIFNNLETSIVVDLQEMLHGINPYAKLYSTVGNYMKINPAKDVNLIMCTTSNDIDPRRYNVPTGTDIAMVIPVENGDLPLNKNIVIYKNVESHPKNIPLMTIDYTHPMYDPLLYVLIFPWGGQRVGNKVQNK